MGRRTPSSHRALGGARVLFNLSASPEGVGKHAYLRDLVAQQSARTLSAYVYCSAGFGESTTDLVFAGNGIIAENGTVLREAERFALGEQLVVADVDLERLAFERRRNTSFRTNEGTEAGNVIEMEIPESLRAAALDRRIDPMPFVPHDAQHRNERCEEIFRIQAHGLARRLSHTGCRKAVVGISGGLDSTLALLVAVRAFDLLGMDRTGIVGITMPGFGTTGRTYNNALQLMRGLGVTVREIPIREACLQHMKDIGLAPDDRSAAYENAQARERTQILMDVANMEGGIVIGTGDLSELALGWATYNGDQMSMYGVNASVPKTLVRHLVQWAADTASDDATRATLRDILDTPVSPELLPADEEGGRSRRRPKTSWAPTSSTTSSSTTSSARAPARRRSSSSPSRRSPAATTVRRSSAGCGPSSGASSRSSSSARRCPTVRRWVRRPSRRAATGACPPTPRRRCGSRSSSDARRAAGSGPLHPALRNRPTPILAPGSRPTNEHEQTQTHDE